MDRMDRNDDNNNHQSGIFRPPSNRLFVSNIHKDVSNHEMNVSYFKIQTIFSGIGKLKKCGIHWDQLGNSRGTADIVYFNRNDAIAAVEKLNGKIVIT